MQEPSAVAFSRLMTGAGHWMLAIWERIHGEIEKLRVFRHQRGRWLKNSRSDRDRN
jgi:hypothetical protein